MIKDFVHLILERVEILFVVENTFVIFVQIILNNILITPLQKKQETLI